MHKGLCVLSRITENALYRFGNPFSAFRLYLTLFRLAETNRAKGLLVSIELDLALEVGLFPFGLGFFN